MNPRRQESQPPTEFKPSHTFETEDGVMNVYEVSPQEPTSTSRFSSKATVVIEGKSITW